MFFRISGDNTTQPKFQNNQPNSDQKMCNRETSNADPSDETPLLSKALRPKPLSNVKMIQWWSLTKFDFTIGSLLHSPSSALPPLEITH